MHTTTTSSRHMLLLLLVSIFAQWTSTYDLVAADVSNKPFHHELTARGQLFTDQLDDSAPGSPWPRSRGLTGSSTDSATDSIPNQTGLPSPFDTSLGNNFTDSSCPTFFTTFLKNATFQSCLPMSLLLQNSLSFFRAAQSQSQIDRTLATSCSASLPVCTLVLSRLAEQMITRGNCQGDYQRQHPLVVQAYNGMLAYEPVYRATCLKDSNTHNLCFTEAMTNLSNPSDAYPYYTAVGMSLPSTARPSCSPCLRQTMDIFSTYAGQKSQPLSQTYSDSAASINRVCGSSFAASQVATKNKVVSAATKDQVPYLVSGLLTITATVLTFA